MVLAGLIMVTFIWDWRALLCFLEPFLAFLLVWLASALRRLDWTLPRMVNRRRRSSVAYFVVSWQLPVPFSEAEAIDPGEDVPTNTRSKKPLIVVAPAQNATRQNGHVIQ